MSKFSKRHVARGKKILKEWARSAQDDEDSVDYQIAGLLADLIHVAASKNLNFSDLLERGWNYYEADLEG